MTSHCVALFFALPYSLAQIREGLLFPTLDEQLSWDVANPRRLSSLKTAYRSFDFSPRTAGSLALVWLF